MTSVPFWIVLGLSVMSWLIYPICLYLFGFLRKKPGWQEPSEWPSVSVLIAARNEEKVIADRICNLLDQDYPGKFEILVGSDDSDDSTDDIAGSFAERGIVLYRSPQRLGKPLIVQELLKLSSGDIIVLTDANTEFAKDTVRQLVLPYSDPRVGCVDGSRMNSFDGTTCESAYWKYEKMIKGLCSRLGAVLGATGAVFSLRREIFQPLTPKRADDFELAVMTRINGYSCVFNGNAIAAEPSPDDSQQYRRVVRIVSWMMISCILLMGRSLRKGRFFLFLQLLVHKMLRWFSGLFLIAATVLAGILTGNPVFAVIFVIMCFFHLLAAAGYFLKTRFPSKLLFPYYFWFMNMASIDGIFKSLSGHSVEKWEKKAREDCN